MRRRYTVLAGAYLSLGLWLGGINPARATLIASDSFLTTTGGTGGTYNNGASLDGQAATAGTTGYFAGAAGGNPAPGWTSGTGAFQSTSATALTNPKTANAPTSSDGSVNALGNANTRVQYRDFASTSPPASTTYFFSALIRESVSSYTGTAFAGLGPSRATGGNGTIPSTGIDVGFVNGAITLFYSGGGTDMTAAADQKTLVATPTAASTYLVEVAATVSGSTATLVPKVYDATGTQVNNSTSQTITNATLATSTDLGSFQTFVTSNFSAGSPAAVNFDEFRFGTAESDVVTPEPASLSLLALSGLGLLARRRKDPARR